jgi:hypothetical protein
MANKRTDWLNDADDDEEIDANGDYVEGPSAIQEAYECMDTVKGEVRSDPTAGFGAVKRIRKTTGNTNVSPTIIEAPAKFRRDLKVELEADGHGDPQVNVTQPDLSDLEVIVDL